MWQRKKKKLTANSLQLLRKGGLSKTLNQSHGAILPVNFSDWAEDFTGPVLAGRRSPRVANTDTGPAYFLIIVRVFWVHASGFTCILSYNIPMHEHWAFRYLKKKKQQQRNRSNKSRIPKIINGNIYNLLDLLTCIWWFKYLQPHKNTHTGSSQ